MQIAQYLQKIDNSVKYDENLREFIKMQMQMKVESFGLSILQFYEALTVKKRLDRIMLRKKQKVSIFDNFSGIDTFLKSVPQSLHFYPSAKKIYKQFNLKEKMQ